MKPKFHINLNIVLFYSCEFCLALPDVAEDFPFLEDINQ